MIDIRPLETTKEAQPCAKMMASSDPWLTLGRSYEASFDLMRDPNREIYLAWLDDEIAGFIILVMQGAFVGYIQSICVTADQRGRGIGRALMTFAENRIWQDSPNVFICVSSFNPRVQAYYQTLGYHVVGELKNYIVTGHSEILLRKTIGSLNDFRAGKLSQQTNV